ncbi:MAG: GNAT family N-acetyltransferase [Candidatus Methylomirabilia bacterium]
MRVGVTIRPCRPEECPAVLNLWREADATPSPTDSLEELTRLIREHGDLFLVAEQDGRIVATILAGWDGWRGNIYRLAVLPNYRRGGIATALVREAERLLFAKGARRLSILVEQQDAQAVAFWNSLNEIEYERDRRMMRFSRAISTAWQWALTVSLRRLERLDRVSEADKLSFERVVLKAYGVSLERDRQAVPRPLEALSRYPVRAPARGKRARSADPGAAHLGERSPSHGPCERDHEWGIVFSRNLAASGSDR